ncbi:MAG: TlpA family protein disulfide reductase [Syntrophaceae bacterium]
MSQRNFIVCIIALALMHASMLGAAEPPELKYNQTIGKIKLAVPEDPRIRDYLGLKVKTGQFGIGQIRPGLLIIQIFNMYCPHCQHYAPRVNEFYKLIQTDSRLKDRVMLIGIGVGNSPFEVDIYRKKFSVMFPLFDDKGYAVYNTLQDVLTPHFIGLILDGKGTYRMFYSKNGGFDDPAAFLNEMLKLSALFPGGIQ